MGLCCGKKVSTVVSEPEKFKDDLLPVAEAVVAEEIPKPQAIEINLSPEEFYGQFKYHYEIGSSKEDKALRAREERKEDRILDLLLIMDCTSSMSSWIELCKNTLKDCIDDLTKQHEELQVRVAFVGFRDIGDKDNIFVIQDFSFDLDHVKNLISETKARGGQDVPEDVQGALYQGLKLSWREVSVKICYLCTDAPCHGRSYHSLRDHYPKGNPAGLELEELMEQYSNRDIDLSVYELTAQTKNMFDIMEQAYNQGQNAGELKRIKLEKEIKEAKKQFPKIELSAPGGYMESVYKTNLNNDMMLRTANQYARHGWSSNVDEAPFSKPSIAFKAQKKKM